MRIASGIATRQSFLNNIRDSMSCSNFDLICGRVRKNAGSYCSCQKAVWTLSSDKPNVSTPENSSTVLKLWTFRRFSPHASSWRNGLLVCKTGGMEGFLLVTCGCVVHSLQILSYHSMSSSYPINAYQRISTLRSSIHFLSPLRWSTGNSLVPRFFRPTFWFCNHRHLQNRAVLCQLCQALNFLGNPRQWSSTHQNIS